MDEIFGSEGERRPEISNIIIGKKKFNIRQRNNIAWINIINYFGIKHSRVYSIYEIS